MKHFFHTTFSSLKVRNYRLYYASQFISVSGTFLSALAQDWLVLQLTNSGTMLGLVSAFQFIPLLVLTPYGGVIADRFPKRTILYFTQTLSLILAATLGILVLTHVVQVWMVFIFAMCLGLTNSLDNPTRQSFVYEMVGGSQVRNAVSLWALLISMSRMIGPTIAGILIATVGIGLCFVLNSLSYLAVLTGLYLMRAEELHTPPPVPREKGQIREGFRYIRKHAVLFDAIVMVAIIGTFTYEWPTSLPLFAKFVLHGNAATYALLSSSMGLGMFVGGLYNARRSNHSQKQLITSAFFFGVCILIATLLTNLVTLIVAFVAVGIFSVNFSNLSNSILQLQTENHMRGRVMAFWAMAFVGSTAIGGPLIGVIGEHFGARASLAVGGSAAIFAAAYGWLVMRRREMQLAR